MRELQAFGFDHHLAGALGLLDLHLGLAGQVATTREVLAQGIQRAHAAFVAGPPSLDTLANPGLLLGELLVEQRVLLRLRLQGVLLAPQVVVIGPGPAAQGATVEFDDARGNSAQKGAVMRHEQQRARPVDQKVLDPGDAVDVQMVGRFVQQQQIGLRDQGLPQQHAPLEATGQRSEHRIARQLQLGQDGFDARVQRPAVHRFECCLHTAEMPHVFRAAFDQMMVLGDETPRLAQTLGDHVEDTAFGTWRYVLRQLGNARAAVDHDFAVVRLLRAIDQTHQRGFSGAVTPDQTDALAALDRQLRMVEHHTATQTQADILEVEEHRFTRAGGNRGADSTGSDGRSGGLGRSPGPLEVVTTEPAGNIDHLADEVKPRHAP